MSVSKLLYILNCIVPKTNIVLFNSFPPFSDNSRELYCYMITNRNDILKKYRLYWGHEKGVTRPEWLSNNTKTIVKKSILGIWIYLRARYIISTHGYFPGSKSGNGQIQINLWHGMGYKKIGTEEKVYRGDKTIATSELYRDVQSNALGIDKDNIYITGLPRNDKLFINFDALRRLGIDKRIFSKILIWLPTYRTGCHADGHVDGKVDSFTPLGLEEKELSIINDALKKRNMCLIIKLHPIEERNGAVFGAYSNIIFISNERLSENNLDLYCLLQETDVLLSDFSSVIVDYLLLDKPIAIVVSDMCEYENNRGFVFGRIEDYLPGPIISSMNAFLDYLDKMDGYNSMYEEKRNSLRNMFHKFNDNSNSKRICEVIFGDVER